MKYYSIFFRKETKLFVICTVTGRLLQSFCRRYIKNHPECLEVPEITIEIKDPSGKTEQILDEIAKEPTIRRIINHLRGGQVQQKLAEILIRVLIKKFIKMLLQLMAEYGLEIGIGIGTTAAFVVTPKKALARYVETTTVQYLLNKKGFVIIVDGKKVYLENCNDGFKYMFKILMDKELPYTEKKEFVTSVFRVNLERNKPLHMVLCLIPILLILAKENPACYFLMLQNLIKAIKEGRISKRIARRIVRRLLKEDEMVDPELLDLID